MEVKLQHSSIERCLLEFIHNDGIQGVRQVEFISIDYMSVRFQKQKNFYYYTEAIAPNQALKLCWPTAGGLKKVIARSAIQIKGAFIITRSVIQYLSRGSE